MIEIINIEREIKHMIKKNSEKILYFILTAIVLSMSIISLEGPRIGSDTSQYIDMKAYLAPLYPSFLAFLQVFIQSEAFLVYAVVIVQTVFAVCVINSLLEILCKEFSCQALERIIIYVLLLSAYFKAIVGQGSCNLWILTEGLSYSLFYFFVMCSILFLSKKTGKSCALLVFSTVLLAACRTQFLTCFGMVMVYGLYLLYKKKINSKKYFSIGMLVLLGVVSVWGLQCGYKKIADQSEEKSWKKARVVRQLFYFAEESDAEKIDDIKERELFIEIYSEMKSRDYILSEMEGNWLNEVEMYSNRCNESFCILLDESNGYIESHFKDMDSIEKEHLLHKILLNQEDALKIYYFDWFLMALKAIPVALAKGLFIYISPLEIIGIIFSVFIVVFMLTLMFYDIICEKKISKEVAFCGFQLIFLFVNIVTTGFMIRPMPRYLAYSFGIFYISLFMLIIKYVKFYTKRVVITKCSKSF